MKKNTHTNSHTHNSTPKRSPLKDFFTCIRNFFFCLRYPFWRIYDFRTGKVSTYLTTYYDEIYPGWQKAFGHTLSKELLKALKEECLAQYQATGKKPKFTDILTFIDIKEK